ncbi:uncharacterized protein LOC112202112 [Rosa chinensis]|uniref:uncharacterized protein LOC112202112 n=1 Tax=Rosa chinensis TaxID=74649 RepID=UPI000D08EE07|nr:uncharacterized protein LOC112202112 [Rosa chinensis]
MGAAGGRFTWSDSSPNERLGCGVCSPAWLSEFGCSVLNLPPSRSDHTPLLLEVCKEQAVNCQGHRLFKFEEMWCSHESFSQAAEEVWVVPQIGRPMVRLCRKVKDTGNYLLAWDRTTFKDRREELESVRMQLDVVLQKPFVPEDQAVKLQLFKRLNELMSIDETYWRQRSRAIWLKERDRNSKFFHSGASN